MAKLNRPSIQPVIKSSDLDKIILAKNKKISEHTKSLELDIKELDKTKSLYKDEIKSLKPDIKNLRIEFDKAQEDLSSIGDDINLSKDTLSELKAKESKAKSMANIHLGLVDKSKEELKEIQYKNTLYLKNLSESNELSSNIKSMVSEIEILSEEVKKLKASKARYKKNVKEGKEIYEEMTENSASIRSHIEKNKKEFIETIEDIDKKVLKAKGESIKSIQKLQSQLADKNLQLDEMDVLISKAESKHDEILKDTEKTKKSLKTEKVKIKKSKDDFEQWKVSALDELARMKLRGRLKNIDKAGLKDVLS
jgi:chromosome segregation ATPase